MEAVSDEASAKDDCLIEPRLERSRTLLILSADSSARCIRAVTRHVLVNELNVVAALEENGFEREPGVKITSFFVEDTHVGPLHDKLPIRSRSGSSHGYLTVGMQNKIVHDYMNIDADIVWEVSTRNIPTLIAQLGPLQNQ